MRFWLNGAFYTQAILNLVSYSTILSSSMSRALAPPPGVYVPAVLYFDENDELDQESIKAHVLRLAKVRS